LTALTLEHSIPNKNTKAKLSDEELVVLIVQSQDDRHITQLYNRYSNKIYRRTISFVKDSATAEDLTHDIFMKILMNLASFKGNSKFSTWIYSITYNYCIDYLRKKQKERKQVNTYSSESDELRESMEDVMEFESLRQIKTERLLELMNKVSVDDKMILLMKYQDNLSIKQIQSIFNISESAVKMRINRAKGKIKKLYTSEYKENPSK